MESKWAELKYLHYHCGVTRHLSPKTFLTSFHHLFVQLKFFGKRSFGACLRVHCQLDEFQDVLDELTNKVSVSSLRKCQVERQLPRSTFGKWVGFNELKIRADFADRVGNLIMLTTPTLRAPTVSSEVTSRVGNDWGLRGDILAVICWKSA